MPGRSRRNLQKEDKLKSLREVQAGLRSRREQFTVSEDVPIYDEVSEDEYRKINRDLLKQSSFVIDDDGEGYGDGVLEDWETKDPNANALDSEDEAETRKSKKSKNKAARKSEAKPPDNLERIEVAFSRANTQSLMASGSHSSSKIGSRKKPPKDANSFMENLLADFGSDDEEKSHTGPQPKRQKTIASSFHSANLFTGAGYSNLKTATSTTAVAFSTSSSSTSPDSAPISPSHFIDQVDDAMDVDDLPSLAPHFDRASSPSPPSKDGVKFDTSSADLKPLEEAMAVDKEMSPEPLPQLSVKKISAQKPKSKIDLASRPPSLPDPKVSAAPPLIGTFHPEKALFEDGSLRFYFLDATEVRNIVYLFGKVKYGESFVSCSLSIRNIERNVFLLPREYIMEKGVKTDVKVQPVDVYNEFSALRSNYKIKKFASKFVDRKYSFEVPGIPDEAAWLKIAYSFEDPPLPSDFSGNTFSHAFGTSSSAIELFILKRRLMGPCWLHIEKPAMQSPSFSWCKLEGVVSNAKQLTIIKDSPPPPPPLTVMAISSKSYLNAKNQQELLVLVALTSTTSFVDEGKMTPVHHVTLVRPPPGAPMIPMLSSHEIKVHQNERSLLNQFVAHLQVQDPDILLGHNIAGFDVDLLMSRLKAIHHPGWSKAGRLRRTQFPKATMYRQTFGGRLLLDTYLASKELVGSSKSYSLNYLALTQLKKTRPDLDYSTIRSQFDSLEHVQNLLEYSLQDCLLAMELAQHLNCLSLYKQLSNICGNLLSRTMTSGRAERNEYLLLHEFHNSKFIVPDKSTYVQSNAKPVEIVDEDGDEMALMEDGHAGEDKHDPSTAAGKSKRKKPQYAGGLVLEPKKGFYDSFVLLLDFNSLYPSIIQEYNICFTTVLRSDEPSMPEVPTQTETGLLPRLLKNLVDRRKAVKKLMKECLPHERAQYNIRQLALKLTANSMYGCLGFSHSRFYCKPLAMLITKLGRDILQNTVDLATQNGMDVIYGDTDSIMIHTGSLDLRQVKQVGRKLQELVNKRYKQLEIEMDGYFERMLLLKKKKYAALVLEEHADGSVSKHIETKGLDLVRRDWCGLSHDVSSFVLQQLLESKESKEQVLINIHEHLKETAKKLRNNEYPTEAFVITKSLTKDPKLYTDQQPHVAVALAMEARGEPVHVGSTIPYVICVSEEKALAPRARHPNDLARDPSLQIDLEWYVAQQIFPPVARLCSEIEGSEQAQLADSLGLDAKKYDAYGPGGCGAERDLTTLESLLTEEERFANTVPLQLTCLDCAATFAMSHSWHADTMQVGWTCTTCQRALPIPTLTAQLTHAIRQHIYHYENQWLVCDDVSCQCRSRSVRVYPSRCWRSPACRGKVFQEYSANQLYRQLTFYAYMFDAERMLKQATLSTEATVLLHTYKDQYLSVRNVIQRYLDRNARSRVDLGALFSYISTKL